jgi:hypothetical protein
MTTDDVVIVYTVTVEQRLRLHPKVIGDPHQRHQVIDEDGNISHLGASTIFPLAITARIRHKIGEDCQATSWDYPDYTLTRVQSITGTTVVNGQATVVPAPPSKGFVAVELYYCYKQALNIPPLNLIIPNPMMIHAYTIMPLPAAAPTATPRTP